MGGPQEGRVCDHTQADKDENVAQVLWIPRKPVGSGRDESGFLSQGILCTNGADPQITSSPPNTARGIPTMKRRLSLNNQVFQSRTSSAALHANTMRKHIHMVTICQDRSRGGGQMRFCGTAILQVVPIKRTKRIARLTAKIVWIISMIRRRLLLALWPP